MRGSRNAILNLDAGRHLLTLLWVMIVSDRLIVRVISWRVRSSRRLPMDTTLGLRHGDLVLGAFQWVCSLARSARLPLSMSITLCTNMTFLTGLRRSDNDDPR